MAEHYDAIVVGAGPAGNAAALTLARAGSRVLQLERAEYPGARNTGGAVLCAAALDELIHDFRTSAPLERQIVEQRVWTLDVRSHVASHFQTDDGSDFRAQRYTVLRAPFDAWLSSAVEQAGVRVVCATTVTGLIHEADGRVIGVRTDRGDNEVFADVVVLGDGIEALVARNAGVREALQPLQVALTVKELRRLPRAAIEERFGISGDDGVILEAAGSLVDGHLGFGFIYTHRESLSVGVGCLVTDVDNDVTTSELLARFKCHPSIRPLLEGSEVASVAAQLYPEGGHRTRPRLFGDGWVTCGDATQMNDGMHREGATMALTSGRLAAETIVELNRHGRPMMARHLSLYRDKLERSPVLRDLQHRRRSTLAAVALKADPRRLAEVSGKLSVSLQGPDDRNAQMSRFQALSDSRSVDRLVGERA